MRNTFLFEREKPKLFPVSFPARYRTTRTLITLPPVFLQLRVSHIARFFVRVVKSKRRR